MPLHFGADLTASLEPSGMLETVWERSVVTLNLAHARTKALSAAKVQRNS